MICKHCGTTDEVIDDLCDECFDLHIVGVQASHLVEQQELPFEDPRFSGSCAGGACDTGK